MSGGTRASQPPASVDQRAAVLVSIQSPPASVVHQVPDERATSPASIAIANSSATAPRSTDIAFASLFVSGRATPPFVNSRAGPRSSSASSSEISLVAVNACSAAMRSIAAASAADTLSRAAGAVSDASCSRDGSPKAGHERSCRATEA